MHWAPPRAASSFPLRSSTARHSKVEVVEVDRNGPPLAATSSEFHWHSSVPIPRAGRASCPKLLAPTDCFPRNRLRLNWGSPMCPSAAVDLVGGGPSLPLMVSAVSSVLRGSGKSQCLRNSVDPAAPASCISTSSGPPRTSPAAAAAAHSPPPRARGRTAARGSRKAYARDSQGMLVSIRLTLLESTSTEL